MNSQTAPGPNIFQRQDPNISLRVGFMVIVARRASLCDSNASVKVWVPGLHDTRFHRASFKAWNITQHHRWKIEETQTCPIEKIFSVLHFVWIRIQVSIPKSVPIFRW